MSGSDQSCELRTIGGDNGSNTSKLKGSDYIIRVFLLFGACVTYGTTLKYSHIHILSTTLQWSSIGIKLCTMKNVIWGDQ